MHRTDDQLISFYPSSETFVENLRISSGRGEDCNPKIFFKRYALAVDTHLHQYLRSSIVFHCPHFQTVMDRDLNAAINLLIK